MKTPMTSKLNIAAVQSFGQTVDFGRTASDYRTFRAGFPAAFFDEITARNYIKADQQALDLGTGTGTIARQLAERGLSVVGVDPAKALLAEAVELDRKAGVTITYREGTSEKLSEADATIDIVTAGQCWHWFDRPAAAEEAARVLVPGGRIIISHFDWLPLPGTLVQATEDLILTFNPDWALGGGNGIYPDWLADLSGAGFTDLETFSFDVLQPYSHEAWQGRIRASAGIKASLGAQDIARFDAALADVLSTDFPDEPLLVPHRVWAATGVVA